MVLPAAVGNFNNKNSKEQHQQYRLVWRTKSPKQNVLSAMTSLTIVIDVIIVEGDSSDDRVSGNKSIDRQ